MGEALRRPFRAFIKQIPPYPPFVKGGKGGFACFVEPASGMGVTQRVPEHEIGFLRIRKGEDHEKYEATAV